jgi:outer membrane protein OmpA-like peptidoglycan-associated protein
MDERSTPVYHLQEASLSYAVNASLSHTQSIALGVKALVKRQNVDLNALNKNASFLSDRNFDNPQNDLSETQALTLSSGIHWQAVNSEGVRTGYFSFSAFDFLAPDVIAKNGGAYPTFVTSGSFRAFTSGNLSLFPEGLYTKSPAADLLGIGFVTRCDVKLSAVQNPYYINVITKYLTNNAGIFGLQYHNEMFSLGASYEAPFKNDNASNIGAFEIGLEIRRLVKPEFRNKTLRKKLNTLPRAGAPSRQPVLTHAGSTTSKSVEDPVVTTRPLTLEERIVSKRDSVLLVSPKPGKAIQIDHHILKVNFGFNSVKMDTGTMRYLDQLVAVLRSDPRLKLKLTGHTDNIGTPSANYQLSLHRANSVKSYLVKHGVLPANVKTEGKGMAQPLNENKNEQQRAKNRRVEVRIYLKD